MFCLLKGKREIRREERLDLMEGEIGRRQRKGARSSLKILDQNVMRGNIDEHNGIRNKNKGK